MADTFATTLDKLDSVAWQQRKKSYDRFQACIDSIKTRRDMRHLSKTFLQDPCRELAKLNAAFRNKSIYAGNEGNKNDLVTAVNSGAVSCEQSVLMHIAALEKLGLDLKRPELNRSLSVVTMFRPDLSHVAFQQGSRKDLVWESTCDSNHLQSNSIVGPYSSFPVKTNHRLLDVARSLPNALAQEQTRKKKPFRFLQQLNQASACNTYPSPYHRDLQTVETIAAVLESKINSLRESNISKLCKRALTSLQRLRACSFVDPNLTAANISWFKDIQAQCELL